MVTVRTTQTQILPDEKALRAEALRRHLLDVTEEFNTTLGDLNELGIHAKISISQEGAAPGN